MILWFKSNSPRIDNVHPRGTINHNCHLQPAPHPTPRSSSIHQRWGEAAIWRWEINFINRFCMMLWTHLHIFRNSQRFVAPSKTPTHINHQPQLTTRRSNIHYWQGDAAMTRWDIIFNTMFLYYIHPHLLFVLTCTSIVTYATINSPNNTTPRYNHPFGLKTKGSVNKKG